MGTSQEDLWSQILASDQKETRPHVTNVHGIYQRRRPPAPPKHVPASRDSMEENRIPGRKRDSWNRSLSIRGRTSIAVGAFVNNHPQQKQARRRARPALPKAKFVQPPSFEKEKQYFQEVDAFELTEESPSPKNLGTWTTGNQTDVELPYISTRLKQFLIRKKLNYSCGPSSTLSKILETPSTNLEPVYSDDSGSLSLESPETRITGNCLGLHPVQNICDESLTEGDVVERKIKTEIDGTEEYQDIEAAVKKLSLASTSSPEISESLAELMAFCGQPAPSKLIDVFSKFCEPRSVTKVGEGTYGEAFRAANCVCKIVPIDGDFRVNGEVQKDGSVDEQDLVYGILICFGSELSRPWTLRIHAPRKRSEEVLEELILSRTLNRLREYGEDSQNSCTTFIEIVDLRVCQGLYDPILIRAWEEWDEKHGSENDHPDFPEKQLYVVFVFKHGGRDLESFVLLNFVEAKSLLVQVTAALAVAEAAFEFEHRDLHWGNILLSRNDSITSSFMLQGKQLCVRTHGIQISIIDFTLSRINNGERIIFLDLYSDPDLFKGPKGDKQAETYRKMREVTEDFWQGSFPRTNVLWIIYLVDILLQKKSFERTSKDERELRSLKKRLGKYESAKEAIWDPFFAELLVNNPCGQWIDRDIHDVRARQ